MASSIVGERPIPGIGRLMARILIVEARFYAHLNDLLLDGARAAIEAAGHATRRSPCPARSKFPARSRSPRKPAATTPSSRSAWSSAARPIHFEIVAGESARGMMALTLDGLAIGNGILTVENEAQALARARPDEKDKGGEAAKAALAMLELKQRFG